MPNVGNVTMKFSILKDGPQGQQVGPPVTAYLEWGGEMIGAEWPGDGLLVEPGAVYFLKVERADGQGVYLYATDSNPYSQGTAFTGNTPHPGWDLFATIRGATVAVDSKLGALVGSVHDETNAPLPGASVTASPGAHSATTSSRGDFSLSLSQGTYDVTASLAGYVPATESAVVVLEGQTAVVDFTLQRETLPPPPPVVNLIANGDFASGLAGWSVWGERGALVPVVDASGRAHLSATGHNGGLYQTFSTGGAGRRIEVDGFWAS
ncbi:MAG: carboxypeptidase-like regulatory domain-containing protein, partial [Vicinamibacteria bacterium]